MGKTRPLKRKGERKMRAETVKRMILMSVQDPPEDLEELVELHARLWAREQGVFPAENKSMNEDGGKAVERPEEPDTTEGPEPMREEEGGGEDDGEPSEDVKAAKGFVHLRCQHCGAEKTWCAKSWTTTFYCKECGEATKLRGMKWAKAVCKCGKQFIYTTNVTDDVFDIPCVECGAPMPVAWVEGRNRYEPCGWKAHSRKRTRPAGGADG